ncbi:hypothetical protein NON27_26620, partial [Vibrio parahaemolyticus]|nr:hypothetical protein [Vibrio parahaemolyticus]
GGVGRTQTVWGVIGCFIKTKYKRRWLLCLLVFVHYIIKQRKKKRDKEKNREKKKKYKWDKNQNKK